MQANIMSNLFALSSRPIQSSSFHLPQEGATAGAHNASASGKVPARLPVVDPVSPSASTSSSSASSSSSSSITLSQQALNSRFGQLGDKTVEAAQRFVGNIAESLFGDAAKGATFHLDTMSVAVDTSSSTSSESAADAGAGAGAGADSAALQIALQMNTSASFIGRGTIATSDGQSFDFEIEVKYTATLQASAGNNSTADNTKSNTTSSAAAQQPSTAPDMLTLTGKQLPAIEFPGSLADLFKVLGRQLNVSANSGQGNGGDISLRLLRLVNSAALLAPRPRADSVDTTPAERNRALASYATPAAASTVTTA
jgi:hypothetical protein